MSGKEDFFIFPVQNRTAFQTTSTASYTAIPLHILNYTADLLSNPNDNVVSDPKIEL
jgi:hypothetical protein